MTTNTDLGSRDEDSSNRQRPAPPESAATLRTVVVMARRIMRADTASVVSFSLATRTATWWAMNGFRTRGADEDGAGEFVTPILERAAEQLNHAEELLLLEGIGLRPELPAADFPLHSAEGVRDLAVVPLRARGEARCALAVGYRAAHPLSADEQETLRGLAELAALALDNARLVETVSTAKKIWEQTFDAMPDGIIVHDAALLVTRCNHTAAEMMGFAHAAEAIGLPCAHAFARLFGERAAAYHMTHRTSTASSFEIQAEDGRRYLVAVAPITSLDTGGAEPGGWSVVTWSDVTELSEMQEQLARSRRLATLGQLAAGVAHEINNPLAAITTCAEAVGRDLKQADPALQTLAAANNWTFYLEEIVRQSLRCKAITRGLLDLTRQRRARRERCDLNQLVERSVLLIAQRPEAQGVELSTALAPEASSMATDEVMVKQILDNLLGNALDAVDGSGQITVTTAADGERVRIEVADTGPGIAPGTLARIFDPFFTTKEAGRGSGLGLAICTTLAEAVGGALTVESKPGVGSRFRLWLPRRAAESGEEE